MNGYIASILIGQTSLRRTEQAVGWLLYLLILAGCVSLYVYSLMWVYRDVKKHNQPAFVVTLLVALLCWPLGLLVWLLVRDNLKRSNTPPRPGAPPRNCPQCGTALAANAPQGLCPACLLKRGVATESGPPTAERAPFVPPTPAQLARHFPELEILELIGRGGMGAVYKARQKQLDRIVALKVLPASVSRDPAFAERFAREARALARLQHPHIVAVHDSGETDGLFYFVMEFVDGMNLRQLLNAGKLAPKEALAIVPQICDALQYAHDKGIVHRDIKPENLLIDKTGTVKIADFGLAKLVGLEAKDLRITGSGDVMGTPHYMAPEQVEHPQDVDHRADIYSLGVVFYQMLTGELPIGRFAAPSKKVLIDVRLDEVVLRALEKEPEHRYQHASELKTRVETIAAGGSKSEAGSQRTEVEPRISSTAVAGACWALLFFLTAIPLSIRTWTWNQNEHSGPSALMLIGWIPLLVGFAAPFATTTLGCVALSQIRRSAGKLYGLGLALFDALLFPLLALDGLILGFWFVVLKLVVVWLHHRNFQPWDSRGFDHLLTVIWVLVTLASSAPVDYLIIRRARRAVNKPGNGSQSSTPTTPAAVPASPPRSRWRRRAVITGIVVLLVLVVRAFVIAPYNVATDSVSPEIPQGNWVFVYKLARTFVTGDVIVYRSDDVNWLARVAEAGPHDGMLQIARRSGLPQSVPVASVVGRVIFNTRIERPQTNANGPLELWSVDASVQNLSFGPVIERVLPEPSAGVACLLDLETGQFVTPPDGLAEKFKLGMADIGDEAVRWLRDSGADAVVNIPNSGSLRLFEGAALSVARNQNPPLRWEQFTPADVVSTLGQAGWERSHRFLKSDRTFYATPALTPDALAFITREGSMGVMEIIGLNANPRGVKIRYKLVRSHLPKADVSIPGTIPEWQNLSFGPDHEIMLNNSSEASVDLDTGRILPAFVGQAVDFEVWKKTNGIDLSLPEIGTAPGVVGYDLASRRSGRWYGSDATPAKVFEGVADVRPETNVFLDMGVRYDANTYAFKTREGGVGLLQITGSTDHPRGVAIRYKLVQRVTAR